MSGEFAARGGILAQLQQDLRYGLRVLRNNPAFTAVTVATLAIGIGATTALFSVLDCLLIRPLPYPDADRLYVVWSRQPRGIISNVSPANFLDFRRQNRVFEHMAAVTPADFNVPVEGVAERLIGFRVTSEFFDTLGVQPAIGRAFTAEEDRPGGPRVALLSYGSWQRRFGGDRRILGQALRVDGESFTIIGVMPPSFRMVFTPEMLVPLAIDPTAAPRDFHVLFGFAKLKKGVPPEQARAEMAGIARGLEQAYPQPLKGWGVELWPWRDNFVGMERQRVLVLFGAVVFVLLIACVNLANLLLAKAAARRGELAVRAALGAGRARLARQMLTESVLLAGLGGAAGVLVARLLVGPASRLVAAPVLDSIAEIGIDWRVLLFTLGLAVLTGLLFGVAPAWRASRVVLQEELKGAGRDPSARASARWFRNALVAAELALSLMLLAGAGLMARSLVALTASDPGFRKENVLTMRLTMRGAAYAEPEKIRIFDRLLLDRLKALPGVRAAALANAMPLQGMGVPMRFQVASRPTAAAEAMRATFQYASEGYLDTLGIRLRKGRFFTAADDERAPRVAVVNEAFVERFLEKEEPLGQRLLLDERWISGGREGAVAMPWEIVGVIANTKISGRDRGSPQIYAPLIQYPRAGGVLAVRTGAAPAAMTRAVAAAVHGVDKEVPVTEVRTMEEIAAASVAQPRSQAWLIGAFAAVALVLAAVGTYGVMSYAVTQRTHEMGIRMALGARPGAVLGMTLRQGMAIAISGVGLGLAGSAAVTRAAQSLLWGVRPTDPLTYVIVSVLLLAVAAVAIYIPARRAARVDPLVALRWE